MDRSLKKGTVKTFDMLDALAANYKIDAAELKKTIERFDGYVEAREDPEFGKLIVKEALPLAAPPFYAARVWPKVHHTMGGGEINEKAQVIDLDGAITSGLYAAGEVTGGIHGACRLGSVAIIDCLVFGRIAGGNAGAASTVRAAAA